MRVENVLAVWPEVLTRIGRRDQNSLIYHLLRERIDVLFAATKRGIKRRSPATLDDHQRATKKSTTTPTDT
jgi:hypothetical protein